MRNNIRSAAATAAKVGVFVTTLVVVNKATEKALARVEGRGLAVRAATVAALVAVRAAAAVAMGTALDRLDRIDNE